VRGRISLSIRVWPQGNSDPKNPRASYTLRCRPASGTLPRARAACARLVRVQNPFAPPSPAEDCAWVGTSGAMASVTGVYGGHHVGGGFNRLTTCDIRHWNRVAFLFPIR
jgi:hypothetical protein